MLYFRHCIRQNTESSRSVNYEMEYYKQNAVKSILKKKDQSLAALKLILNFNGELYADIFVSTSIDFQ